jgi:hypothetical protein
MNLPLSVSLVKTIHLTKKCTDHNLWTFAVTILPETDSITRLTDTPSTDEIKVPFDEGVPSMTLGQFGAPGYPSAAVLGVRHQL